MAAMKTLRFLVPALLLAAGPVAAEIWEHPAEIFVLDLPTASWFEVAGFRTNDSATIAKTTATAGRMTCAIHAGPASGAPHTPATWTRPNTVLAAPGTLLATMEGDKLVRVLGKRRYEGADGFAGVQVWGEIVEGGKTQPSALINTQSLLDGKTMVFASCILPAPHHAKLTKADIVEALDMSASVRRPDTPRPPPSAASAVP